MTKQDRERARQVAEQDRELARQVAEQEVKLISSNVNEVRSK